MITTKKTISETKALCHTCRRQIVPVPREAETSVDYEGKQYTFRILKGVCPVCGSEVVVNAYQDMNIELFDEAVRRQDGLIRKSEIEDLLRRYDIGKEPLALALGFGRVTVKRYTLGQMPSKQYSDIMRRALYDPCYMKECLEKNKEKVGKTAYNKAMARVNEYIDNAGTSKILMASAAYLIAKVEDITALALQKLLYFSQGLSFVINNAEIFPDDCEAWVHGPVYRTVYYAYKNENSPLHFEGEVPEVFSESLSEKDRLALDLSAETFGNFSGKMLESLTHKEAPWQTARGGISSIDYSADVISKESIKQYFGKVNETYDLRNKAGIMKYISDMQLA